MKKLLITLLTVLFFTGTAWSATICLEWNPNSEPDLAGYRIFYAIEGQEYIYHSPAWEGTATNCCIGGLAEGETYCFVARAYDTEGLESRDSNEPCGYITPGHVNTPPYAPEMVRITSITLEPPL